MAQTIFKGVLQFGDVDLPVRLYAAVEDRSVHFHLLHDQDHERLQQRLVNPDTGDTVAYADAQRGLEVERGGFVVLDSDELESLTPKSTRDMDVLCLVDPALVNHQWYDRPYFLGPDGDDDAYFACAQALADSGREAIVRWVMRKKSYVGALRHHQGYLALITLRSANEVLDASSLAPKQRRELRPNERKMAEQLIQALAEPFEPEQFHDEYRSRVRELIESKQQGRKLPEKKAAVRPATLSLEKALAASLQGATKS